MTGARSIPARRDREPADVRERSERLGQPVEGSRVAREGAPIPRHAESSDGSLRASAAAPARAPSRRAFTDLAINATPEPGEDDHHCGHEPEGRRSPARRPTRAPRRRRARASPPSGRALGIRRAPLPPWPRAGRRLPPRRQSPPSGDAVRRGAPCRRASSAAEPEDDLEPAASRPSRRSGRKANARQRTDTKMQAKRRIAMERSGRRAPRHER